MKPALQFGEKLSIRVAKGNTGNLNRDLELVTVEARSVGHNARTGAVLGIIANVIVVGSCFTRLSESERWAYAGWEQLRGPPWNVEAQPEQPAAGAGEAPPVAVPMPAN